MNMIELYFLRIHICIIKQIFKNKKIITIKMIIVVYGKKEGLMDI